MNHAIFFSNVPGPESYNVRPTIIVEIGSGEVLGSAGVLQKWQIDRNPVVTSVVQQNGVTGKAFIYVCEANFLYVIYARCFYNAFGAR